MTEHNYDIYCPKCETFVVSRQVAADLLRFWDCPDKECGCFFEIRLAIDFDEMKPYLLLVVDGILPDGYEDAVITNHRYRQEEPRVIKELELRFK